jgi:phosphatidylglycerol:prolipoprotein diacylglycerol transferase
MMMMYIALWVGGIVAGSIAYLLVLWSRRALSWTTFTAGVLAILGLLYGAKLQYRLEHFPLAYSFAFSPLEIFEPGVRIPLGIFFGGLLPILWCLALRAPWRHVGDALALGGPAMVAIGRMACFSNGCCMGTACGRWALPVCMTFPPGSEAYNAQLRDNLIQLSAAESLPAHPLPLYFAAGGLCIFVVMLWMLRRRTAPGLMFVVSCTLAAASKLALETLRAEPRSPGIMFEIPELVLAAGSVVLLVLLVRRLAARPAAVPVGGVKGAIAGLLALALGLAGPRAALADGTGRHVPTAEEALTAYAQNPLKNRRGLRLLEHSGTDGVPPVVLLAMGDARLRSGQRRQAERLFNEVLDRESGEPWESWARLGLGWNALMAGDVDAARPYFADIAEAGGGTSGMARLLVALIDASDGKDVGVQVFDQVAADESAAANLRDVARLAGGYARYWRGDYHAAAEALDAALAKNSSRELTDDLQYAAAWSRVRGGDREHGEAALRALAGDGKVQGPPVSVALLNLDQRAMLRANFERYRRGPLNAPEARVAELLDGNGKAMARAALRHVDEAPQMAESAPLRRAVAVSYAAPAAAGVHSEPDASRPAVAKPSAPAATSRNAARGAEAPAGGHAALFVVLAVLLVAGFVFATWRRPSRPGPRSRGW